MDTTITTTAQQIETAVAARKGSLAALRERITALLEPVPVGVVLSDEHGEVCRIIRVETGASQWSNSTWEVTIRGWAAITPTGRLLCESLDGSYWDGGNLCHRSTEPTVRSGDRDGTPLRPETGRETRAAAARLGATIECYLAECAREVAANEAVTATI